MEKKQQQSLQHFLLLHGYHSLAKTFREFPVFMNCDESSGQWFLNESKNISSIYFVLDFKCIFNVF